MGHRTANGLARGTRSRGIDPGLADRFWPPAGIDGNRGSCRPSGHRRPADCLIERPATIGALLPGIRGVYAGHAFLAIRDWRQRSGQLHHVDGRGGFVGLARRHTQASTLVPPLPSKWCCARSVSGDCALLLPLDTGIAGRIPGRSSLSAQRETDHLLHLYDCYLCDGSARGAESPHVPLGHLGFHWRKLCGFPVWTVPVRRLSSWPSICRSLSPERVVRRIARVGNSTGRRPLLANLVRGLRAGLVWGLSGRRDTAHGIVSIQQCGAAWVGAVDVVAGSGCHAGRPVAHFHSQCIYGAFRRRAGSAPVSPETPGAGHCSRRCFGHRSCTRWPAGLADVIRRAGISG